MVRILKMEYSNLDGECWVIVPVYRCLFHFLLLLFFKLGDFESCHTSPRLMKSNHLVDQGPPRKVIMNVPKMEIPHFWGAKSEVRMVPKSVIPGVSWVLARKFWPKTPTCWKESVYRYERHPAYLGAMLWGLGIQAWGDKMCDVRVPKMQVHQHGFGSKHGSCIFLGLYMYIIILYYNIIYINHHMYIIYVCTYILTWLKGFQLHRPVG